MVESGLQRIWKDALQTAFCSGGRVDYSVHKTDETFIGERFFDG
ncbi:MAG: hypothetical protein ACR2PF_16595 [Rhizobiaceae bacterium]